MPRTARPEYRPPALPQVRRSDRQAVPPAARHAKAPGLCAPSSPAPLPADRVRTISLPTVWSEAHPARRRKRRRRHRSHRKPRPAPCPAPRRRTAFPRPPDSPPRFAAYVPRNRAHVPRPFADRSPRNNREHPKTSRTQRGHASPAIPSADRPTTRPREFSERGPLPNRPDACALFPESTGVSVRRAEEPAETVASH